MTATKTRPNKTATAAGGGDLALLPVSHIHESKNNPRRTFDAKSLAELAKSVKDNGVQVPLIVRKDGSGYEVVAGARRLRAANLAGLETLPCMVRELNDEEAHEVSIIENLQRQDVHPMEESDAYVAMVASGKYGKEGAVGEIAARVGKSPEYVGRRLQYQALTKKARAAFLSGDLLMGHADLLCRLQPKDQDGYVGPVAGGTGMTVAELKGDIAREIHLLLKQAPFAIDDASLLKRAGACTVCPKRTGATASLFGEEAGDDKCSDRACFMKKTATHFERIAGGLEQKGNKVVFVKFESMPGGEYCGRPVLCNSWHTKQFEPSKAATGTKGIVIEGDKVHKVGDVIDVTVVKKPAAKASTKRSSAEERERDALRKERQKVKRKIGREYRERLRAAIEAKLPKRLDLSALRGIASTVVTGRRECREGLVLLGKKDPQDETRARKAWPDAIAKATEQDVIRLVFMSGCSRELEVKADSWNLDHTQCPVSENVAAGFGIECTKILEEVKRANPCPKKDKPKQSPTAKKKQANKPKKRGAKK